MRRLPLITGYKSAIAAQTGGSTTLAFHLPSVKLPCSCRLNGPLNDKAHYQKYYKKAIYAKADWFKSGANQIWRASVMIMHAALFEDSIWMLSRNVLAPIKITDGEGLQVDGSYHQHGPQLYNGSYGATAFATLSQIIPAQQTA